MVSKEEWFFDACVLLFITLWCIGTVLNVVLLIVFARHPETRTPENILLINLCISDLAYLLSFLTFFIEKITRECSVFVISQGFTIALNTYSVAAISVQRYVGLVTYRIRLPTDKTDYTYSLLIMAGVWSTALIVTAGEIFLMIQYEINFCASKQMVACVYRLFMHGVIPSAIIVVLYVATAHRVNRSALHLPGAECEALQTLREQRKRSARILFALAVVFVVTYTPLLLFKYLYTISDEFARWRLVPAWIAFLMSTFNPIFNPIALCIASRQLRELYHKYCCCCCCQTPATQTRSTVTHNRSVTVEEVKV